jgi:hypothetical protein
VRGEGRVVVEKESERGEGKEIKGKKMNSKVKF